MTKNKDLGADAAAVASVAPKIRKERYCGMCDAWFQARVGKECPKCGFDLSEPIVNLMDALEVALPKQSVSNAHLIAAAPDMLAALKAMVASYDGLRDALTCKTVIAKLAAADAAIAKAEGR